ncbi:MAG: 1-acyl-sn-glycerol-3-phosphate acyltransferase, partial [Burkholderiaceae bacterium]
MRRVLAPLRIVALLAHIVAGLAITTLAFPWLAQTARNRIVRGWSRVLLAICGVTLRASGRALDDAIARTGIGPGSSGRLLLANHVSWIDVFAILACVPCRFVAKAEIGRWPLVGWLVTLVGTLYIERGRRHAVAAINHRVRDRLKAGETVAVFAEGTTTDGFSLLPFHSNLIAPALEVGGEVWFDSEAGLALPPQRRRAGMVFQNYALFPHMTVERNIAYGLESERLAAAEVKRRVGEVLDTVGLTALARRRPSALSGGQRQRVA